MKILKGKDATAYARTLDEAQKIHLLYEYVKLMRDNIVEGEPFILIDDDGTTKITTSTIWPGNESMNPFTGIGEAVGLVYGTTALPHCLSSPANYSPWIATPSIGKNPTTPHKTTGKNSPP